MQGLRHILLLMACVWGILGMSGQTRKDSVEKVKTLEGDTIAEVVVTRNVKKMVIKNDTVVYNADAYQVPEGSVIEALVEALPGAKIDEDGKISINGKDVKRFKMDGRDFMTGNNDAVMKNLPSYVVDQVKAYDEKSDLSRMTGIDDGNDDFVLEFVTKRSARRGLQANPDVGYGTHNRYGIRLTAMKPFGDVRYTFMGNANNVNDRNFTGRGGRGRGNGQGQRETKTAALDVSYEKQNKLKVSGRVTWNHNDADNWNKTGSESFVITRGGAFSNSVNQSYSRANNWTGNMNLQWTIDSLTTLSWRPDVSFNTNDSRSHNTSASFNADPYKYVSDPLSIEGLRTLDEDSLVVNSRQNKSLGYGDGNNINSQLQLFRRIGRKGRNVALNFGFSYRDGDNQNASLSAVHLYQQKNSQGLDSLYQTNRYSVSPNKNLNYSLGITYTEPLLTWRTERQANAAEGSSPGTSSQRIVASLKEQIAKESESTAELPTDNPDRVMPALTVEGERYVGILSIPALDLTLPVGEWFSDDSIQVTPCLYSGSIYKRDMVIGAHNYDAHFGRISTLGIGDEVKFTDAEGHEFDCEVVNIETLRPEQTEELTVKKSKNDWDISLFTCNYSGSERVTVRCAIR